MNILLKTIAIIFLCIAANAREKGETEITTEDGIKAYRNRG